MTKEEAIELLEDLYGAIEDNHGRDYDEAFRMAIKALSAKPQTDLISRADAIEVIRKAYFDKEIQSAKDDLCIVDAMTDWAIRQIKELPSAEAVSRVPKGIYAVCGNKKVCEDVKRNLDMTMCSIFELDTHYDLLAEAAQGWIPCSERLPQEKHKEVLVTERHWDEAEDPIEKAFYRTEIGYIGNDNEWYSFGSKAERFGCKILAWMPLPKPYKDGKKEEK